MIKNIKKAAMFGLESRMLKKQFGKLFLVRMHSVDSLETRGASVYTKRGAMFGLDARIALAIFGALSVISGAALYSAIQAARIEVVKQTFSELNKAYEQYLLDNGQYLPQYNASTLYASDLVVNRQSLSTWKGPYISSTGVGGTSFDTSHGNKSGYYTLIEQLKSSTWADLNLSNLQCVVGNIDCSSWISFVSKEGPGHDAFIQNTFNQLDKIFDSSDGGLAGRVRLNNDDVLRLQFKSLNKTRS